jgi:ABC-type glycerol-3-phosphate transport system substrate-binding protein
MLSGLLTGCTGNQTQPTNEPKPTTQSATTPAPAAGGGKTTVQFWHSLGGKTGDYLNEMIKRFNESQNKVEVVGTFQVTIMKQLPSFSKQLQLKRDQMSLCWNALSYSYSQIRKFWKT